MSKKIKDENGNVYVQKKPFYKKVWFWLLVVIVVICAGGALGGGDGSKSSDSSSAASSKKSNDADKTISENAEFRKKFDAIKVGDLMNHGMAATLLQTLKSHWVSRPRRPLPMIRASRSRIIFGPRAMSASMFSSTTTRLFQKTLTVLNLHARQR